MIFLFLLGEPARAGDSPKATGEGMAAEEGILKRWMCEYGVQGKWRSIECPRTRVLLILPSNDDMLL